jgi:hypothetical protein
MNERQAIQIMLEADPVPDARAYAAEILDQRRLNPSAFLTATDERNTMTQMIEQHTESSPTPPRPWWQPALAAAAVVLAAVAAALVISNTSDDAVDVPGPVPVTIVAQVDFDDRPVIGTFEVTEGADVLQCSSGTFVDGRVNQANHLRVFTCESGSNEGTFTAIWTINDPSDPPTGPLEGNGTWNVSEGTDDFVGLQGGGGWSEVGFEDRPQSVDTWTGDIEYTR